MDYRYKAELVRVIDGDSIEADVDLGFRITIRMKIRLAHINAPELNQDGGHEAKAHLVLLLQDGLLDIQTFKPRDKYGNWLAEVYVYGDNVNSQMITDGHAVSYEGGVR